MKHIIALIVMVMAGLSIYFISHEEDVDGQKDRSDQLVDDFCYGNPEC